MSNHPSFSGDFRLTVDKLRSQLAQMTAYRDECEQQLQEWMNRASTAEAERAALREVLVDAHMALGQTPPGSDRWVVQHRIRELLHAGERVIDRNMLDEAAAQQRPVEKRRRP